MSNKFSSYISTYPRILHVGGEIRKITIHARQAHVNKVVVREIETWMKY